MNKEQLLRRARVAIGARLFEALEARVAQRDAPDYRHARLAHWASLTSEAHVRASEVPVRASWDGCLIGDVCLASGVCLLALRRERAILQAKYAVALARAQVTREYPRR